MYTTFHHDISLPAPAGCHVLVTGVLSEVTGASQSQEPSHTGPTQTGARLYSF